MPNKTKTLLKLLSFEKEKLEERIQALLTEKEVLNKKIKLEKLVVDLNQEKEELDERIESLKKEKEDIISHRKVLEIIGDLKCPKDFQCYKSYKSEYDELCKAGVNGKPGILCCLEEEPDECIFSLSYRDTYYCQCPLRNYIAEKFGK